MILYGIDVYERSMSNNYFPTQMSFFLLFLLI